jgi:hypothetical protein
MDIEEQEGESGRPNESDILRSLPKPIGRFLMNLQSEGVSLRLVSRNDLILLATNVLFHPSLLFLY